MSTHTPVHTGNEIPEWCRDVADSFQAMKFSVPVEFWMLDWKHEIRIRTDDFDTVRREMLEQLPGEVAEETRETAIGWQMPYWVKIHPLAGWGIVR